MRLIGLLIVALAAGCVAKNAAEPRSGCAQPQVIGERAWSGPGNTLFREANLPEVRLLHILNLLSDGKGGSAPELYPMLPKGGIDGPDLCAHVLMNRSTVAGEGPDWRTTEGIVLTRRSLMVRSDVDYARAYPEAYPLIRERAQMESVPPARYLWVQFPRGQEMPKQGDPVLGQIFATAIEHGAGDCDSWTMILPKQGAMFIPFCPRP